METIVGSEINQRLSALLYSFPTGETDETQTGETQSDDVTKTGERLYNITALKYKMEML